MRNLLEESSVAQRLDGEPSDGEPAFPHVQISEGAPLAQPPASESDTESNRKFMRFARLACRP
jgi:hypothetical protein